jgi:hypothetical protein
MADVAFWNPVGGLVLLRDVVIRWWKKVAMWTAIYSNFLPFTLVNGNLECVSIVVRLRALTDTLV